MYKAYIHFGTWVEDIFQKPVNHYCDILINRIDPIFAKPDEEFERSAQEFMEVAGSWYGDDVYEAGQAAHEHAFETVWQFVEMRPVFLATGVSGLFHLFEKQLYRHVNRELQQFLTTKISDWRSIQQLISQFKWKVGDDKECLDLINTFNDQNLRELRLVANAVKHGENGRSYHDLVNMRAPVVDAARLRDNGTVGPLSVLNVNLSVQIDDVIRYRNAIGRFWSLKDAFWAPVAIKHE